MAQILHIVRRRINTLAAYVKLLLFCILGKKRARILW